MDEINVKENAKQHLQEWAKKKCGALPITKISVDVQNEDTKTEDFLTNAGFQKKALIYRISKETAEELLKNKKDIQIEEGSGSVHLVDSVASPFFQEAKTLFAAFNPTMKVPGLFKASASALFHAGGKIYIYEDTEAKKAAGLISFGYFVNKEGQTSILIDSLFIDPNKRKQQLASKLIKYALEQVFKEGVKVLYWETGLGRKEAQTFYEKLNIGPYGIAFRYQPSKGQFVWNFGWTILGNALF
jgi:GNAT superfamily N-acetyltransferase